MSQLNREDFLAGSLGIDPGWKNLGWALVIPVDETWKVSVFNHGHANPSTFKKTEHYVKSLCDAVEDDLFYKRLQYLRIERYVSYGNVRSTETENITSIIGMLRYGFWHRFGDALDVDLIRAIDWKTKLVKLLSRHYGFSNPSKKMELDKQFSIAAAKFISTTPEVITNDHIADAVCLAALPILERHLESRTRTDDGEAELLSSRGIDGAV